MGRPLADPDSGPLMLLLMPATPVARSIISISRSGARARKNLIVRRAAVITLLAKFMPIVINRNNIGRMRLFHFYFCRRRRRRL